MEIKLSKEGLTKTGVILLLLSGLVFHDFFILPGVKIGPITITYLRVILVVCIPLLLFFYKVKIRKNDILAYFLIIFMLYGLTRIEGNLKEAFALYCPLIAFFILYFSIDDKRTIDKCVDFLAGMLIVFCVVGLFEIFSGQHFVETHLELIEDVSLLEEKKHIACGMYYNENDFSAFLSVLIIYMLNSNFKKRIKIVFVLLSFVIICVNKSVLCILGLFVFTFIAFVIYKKNNITFRFISIVILVSVLIKPSIELINSSSWWWRSYMYSFGIKNVMSHLLIGTGIGNFSKEMIALGFDNRLSAVSADPHNLFYELAGEFGIIWAIMLILLFIKLALWNFKKAKYKYNLFSLGMILMIPFIGLASSSCMEKNYIYLALLIPVAYYRFYISKLQADKNAAFPVLDIQKN